MSQHVRFEAILLRVVNYSERDRIVTYIARGVGKQSAFAPGARRSQRRFPGGLELFRLYQLAVRRKNGNGMGTLLEANPIRSLPDLSGSLEHIAHASCGLELVRALLRDEDPQDAILDALWYVLEVLHGIPAHETDLMGLALRWLELRLLAALGLAPVFDACMRCMAPLREAPRVFFSASGGGILCPSCVEESDRAQGIDRPQALLLGLQRLTEDATLDAILERASARRDADQGQGLRTFVRSAGRLNKQLIQNTISTHLKAYDFLESLPRAETDAAADASPRPEAR